MMISAAGASDPYAAAAALDRQLRSSTDCTDDASSGSSLVAAGPDVVVTLGKGSASAPSTYDASGKMTGAPTRDDLGANAPDSMAKASESNGDDPASPDPTSASGTASSASDSTADATADQDASVTA